jgi:hypothetical protein
MYEGGVASNGAKFHENPPNGSKVIRCKTYGETSAHLQIRGPFEKFADWRQCAAVIQREAVTYTKW